MTLGHRQFHRCLPQSKIAFLAHHLLDLGLKSRIPEVWFARHRHKWSRLGS